MSLRATSIEAIRNGQFDVLVVGGGINGAVSAAALAGRGARVCVIDRGDFAGFTSQESSNLVWGGFKYLENFEIPLVLGLCRSRNRLMKAYPDNIREVGYLAALDRSAPYAPWFAGLGALAYWALGMFATKAPRLYGREATKRAEPVIDIGTVRGSIEYRDAVLAENDSRFVFSFVRSAIEAGATAANYVELVSAERVGGVWQARLRDTDSGTEFTTSARVIVNATGPFVDEFNREHGITSAHRLVFSKGVHLIVRRLTTRRHDRVLAFFDDTGRLFYVIPMGDRSVIGTTDTRVDDPHTHVTPDDREFLLDQINKRLDLAEPLTSADVLAERSGARPLVVPATAGSVADADWTSLSRRHAIEAHAQLGVVTIFGGKLTDCLNVGREVAKAVTELGVALERDRSNWYGEPPAATRAEFLLQAERMGLDELHHQPDLAPLSRRLWRRHGVRAFGVLEAIRADPTMGAAALEATGYVRAEVYEAARTEMIVKLEDFMLRRSRIDLVDPDARRRDPEGLREVARVLFGDDADRRLAEYVAGQPASVTGADDLSEGVFDRG